MPLRLLTEIERQRVKRLTAESVDITLLQPTWTALDKGYMDATAPVRNYLKQNGLHDYDEQGRGARENGEKIEAYLFNEIGTIRADASLYKPKAAPTLLATSLTSFQILFQFPRKAALLLKLH